MANPSSRWDFIPVWGIYLNPVTNQPTPGVVSFSVSSRITRVDGRIIYPEGATVAVTVGSTGDQDSTVRESIRAAWRAYDEANEPSFDGSAWDVWWSDTIVPALICTRFPASDDPDIVQTGYSVTVKEALASGAGKQYAITPLLSHLDAAIPGINLGTIEVPPGSPTVPAPMYAKGVAGGVASLDAAAKVPLEQIPDGVGGASTVAELTDAGTAGKAVVQAETAADARYVIGAQPAGSYATAAQGALADTAVQPADLTKAAVGLGSVDDTPDVDKPVSAAPAAALAGKADLVGGKLPTSQLPDLAVTSYKGSVANEAAMLALTGEPGDWCTRSDLGTNWVITGADPTLLANWVEMSYPAAPVPSVNGQTGAITIEGIVVGSTAKATPIDADVLPIVDSAASNVLKKLTWANLKATLLSWVAGFLVRFDVNDQGLDSTQQANARTNIAAAASADLAAYQPAGSYVTSAEVASFAVWCYWDGDSWQTLAGSAVPTSTALVRIYDSTQYDTAGVTAPTHYNALDKWWQKAA